MPPTLGAGYNNQSKRRDLELGVSVHKLFGELDEIAADLGNVGRQQWRVVDVAEAGPDGAVNEQNVRFFHLRTKRQHHLRTVYRIRQRIWH